MQTENNLFDIIDFCLKKKNLDIETHNFKANYILNRWLSMSDKNIAKIVNSTVNKWLFKNNSINVLKFYRMILPKIDRDIRYIKKATNIKNNQEDHENDISTLAVNLELSTREIEMYEDTIDFLNQNRN
jgi:hypothetical protein